jgi:hypothetical protein
MKEIKIAMLVIFCKVGLFFAGVCTEVMQEGLDEIEKL